VIFSAGAVALAWFVFRLWVAPRRAAEAVAAGNIAAE
jgi:nitric oxide reductase subunit B